ncbi:MAG: archease [Candidatus Aenigmatarchaeota archaeon]
MVKLKKKFETVDITTADVAIAAYGKNLEELFENAALGMMNIITNTKKIKKNIKKDIKVDANDLESLMFNWLNEILFYIDAYQLLFSKFKIKIEEIDNKKLILQAICYGDRITNNRYEIKTHIKAATYHNLKIEKNKVWKSIIIFDI